MSYGVPYYIDAANCLFTWDTEAEPQPIGTYDPTTGQVSYAADHLAKGGAQPHRQAGQIVGQARCGEFGEQFEGALEEPLGVDHDRRLST